MGKTFNTGRLGNGLFVDANGNVGIGTTIPNAPFNVVKDDGISSGLHILADFNRNTSSAELILGYYADGTNVTTNAVYSANSLPLAFYTGATERIRVTATGNVGIGTSTSLTSLFTINGSLALGANWGVSGSTFNIIPDATGTNGVTLSASYWSGGYGPIKFNTSDTERVRITSSGYIGIGTTAPGAKVTIIRDSPYNTGDQGLRIKATDGDGYNLWMGASVNGYATIQSYQDNVGGKPLLLNPLNGGNVGIGTISPSATLQVQGSAPYIEVKPNSGSRYIDIGNWDASTNFIEAGGGTLYIKTQQAYSVSFGTSNTERVRITAQSGTGNLVVGGSTCVNADAGRGTIAANGTINALLGLQVNDAEYGYIYHAGSNGNMYLNNSRSNATTYIISNYGGVYLSLGATSWTGNSDERLKNITGNIESAIDALMTLRTVKHTWKSDNTNKEHLALIAQDVEKVFPQVIDRNTLPYSPNQKQIDKTEYLGVRYQELTPVLVKAIQEQQAQIEEKNNKIIELEQKVNQLWRNHYGGE